MKEKVEEATPNTLIRYANPRKLPNGKTIMDRIRTSHPQVLEAKSRVLQSGDFTKGVTLSWDQDITPYLQVMGISNPSKEEKYMAFMSITEFHKQMIQYDNGAMVWNMFDQDKTMSFGVSFEEKGDFTRGHGSSKYAEKLKDGGGAYGVSSNIKEESSESKATEAICAKCNGKGITDYGSMKEEKCPDCDGTGDVPLGTRLEQLDKKELKATEEEDRLGLGGEPYYLDKRGNFNKKQIKFGWKNHNVDTYLAKALDDYEKGITSDPEEYAKLQNKNKYVAEYYPESYDKWYYTCPICNKLFDNPIDFYDHGDPAHPDYVDNDTGTWFKDHDSLIPYDELAYNDFTARREWFTKNERPEQGNLSTPRRLGWSKEVSLHISKHHGDHEIMQTCEECGITFGGDVFLVNEKSMEHVLQTGHTTFLVNTVDNVKYGESLEFPVEVAKWSYDNLGSLFLAKTQEWWDLQEYGDKLSFLSERFRRAGELAKARWVHLPSHVKDSVMNWIDRSSVPTVAEKFKTRKQQQWYNATDQTFYDDEPHENRKVEGESIASEGFSVRKRDFNGNIILKAGTYDTKAEAEKVRKRLESQTEYPISIIDSDYEGESKASEGILVQVVNRIGNDTIVIDEKKAHNTEEAEQIERDFFQQYQEAHDTETYQGSRANLAINVTGDGQTGDWITTYTHYFPSGWNNYNEDGYKNYGESKASEGGFGSGKKGHSAWMKDIEFGGNYKKCPLCNINTNFTDGKCEICGNSFAGEKKIANEDIDMDEFLEMQKDEYRKEQGRQRHPRIDTCPLCNKDLKTSSGYSLTPEEHMKMYHGINESKAEETTLEGGGLKCPNCKIKPNDTYLSQPYTWYCNNCERNFNEFKTEASWRTNPKLSYYTGKRLGESKAEDIDWTEDKPEGDLEFYCPLCHMTIEEKATYDGVFQHNKQLHDMSDEDAETLAKGFTYSNSPPTSSEVEHDNLYDRKRIDTHQWWSGMDIETRQEVSRRAFGDEKIKNWTDLSDQEQEFLIDDFTFGLNYTPR